MKKIVMTVVAALLAVAALLMCACTPDAQDAAELYKAEGYEMQPFPTEQAGVDKYDTDYYFSVVKDINSDLKCAYVIRFRSLQDAKDYVSTHSADKDKEGIVRQGKLVVYGDKDAVAVITG